MRQCGMVWVSSTYWGEVWRRTDVPLARKQNSISVWKWRIFSCWFLSFEAHVTSISGLTQITHLTGDIHPCPLATPLISYNIVFNVYQYCNTRRPLQSNTAHRPGHYSSGLLWKLVVYRHIEKISANYTLVISQSDVKLNVLAEPVDRC